MQRVSSVCVGLLAGSVCAGAGPVRPAGGSVAAAQDTVQLPQEELVADVGQLVDFLEATHPDPYPGGGKLAFQRRVHRLLRTIPESGLTRGQFHALLRPLVAAVGDGHTRVQPLRATESDDEGPGLPVEFRVLARNEDTPEAALFIQAIADPAMNRAGARLKSIAGVGMDELIERQRRWTPYENEFGNLENLAGQLATAKGIRELIPEWRGRDSVAITWTTARGEHEGLRLALGPKPGASGKASTSVRVPESRGGEPAYRFTDADRRVALLRLDNTWAHREVFESLVKHHQASPPFDMRLAGRFYESYRGEAPPADTAAVVSALPAASDLFGELVQAMREASTTRLVVDLRNNGGGHSMLVNMLLYYLYGRQGWADFFGNFYTVRRLSTDDVDGPAVRKFPERVGDYDFSSELDAADRTPAQAGSEGYWRHNTITFGEVLEHDRYEAFYAPPELIALVSPRTFSGGFWVAASLRRMGAKLVGVPAGQAGNAFANVKYLTLQHSGLTVGVSSRLYTMFPEEGTSYPVLPVDVPLTYERWASTGFDANAEIVLALSAGR